MKTPPLITALLCAVTALTSWAGPGTATRDDAVAMVKKGVAYLRAHGADKGYAAINDRNGPFVDRDLYLVVYDMTGRCLAHGANERQVGRGLIELTDVDGRFFIRERIAMVTANPSGAWQTYKFGNPVTRKIQPKAMYCEKLAETAVCAGVYP